MTAAPGRIALVTGASRGIGRETALALSAQGLRVALLARDRSRLDQAASHCPGETLVLAADVTDPAGLEQAFAAVETAWGPVEVLVAAAGAGHAARVERTTDADWQRMLDLNLTAPFRCVRRAVPGMRAARWGRIVVVASTAARIGEPYIAAYAASKHGVLGMVRAVAAELAAEGITVNAVCPGYVDTDMTAATIAAIAARTGRSESDARAILERKQPIGRLITTAEVAAAIWFCVASGAVTGQAVTVDGGTVP